jgi:septal ring-binding cell division protein DamX
LVELFSKTLLTSIPITKECTWYILTDKWILAQKLRILKIQFTNQMKLKKKEDQSVDTSVLLMKGNKITVGEDTETKCGARTEGKAIQELPHLGICSTHCQCLTNTEVDALSQPLD